VRFSHCGRNRLVNNEVYLEMSEVWKGDPNAKSSCGDFLIHAKEKMNAIRMRDKIVNRFKLLFRR
jgi:hypothetical protein